MNEYVAIIGGVVVIAGCIVGVYAKMNGKHSRIYERIDERMGCVSRDFRTKDVCDEKHVNVSAQLEVIKSDVDEIKSDVKKLVGSGGG